ncbi:MAG: HAMP domain-containing sensor histidine kinase, partial [Chloroflexota bacterium]
DAFAHTVAHDLKNPLSHMVTSLNIIEDESDCLPEEIQQIVNLSVQASYKMNSIIQELLLLASVRKQQVQLQPVDMTEVVEQALGRLPQLIKQYQPTILLPDTWPIVESYAPWLEEIWVNYLSNGLKYGGSPPRLELGANTEEDGQVRFWIKDNGPGLTPEAQETLFTEFTRLETIRVDGHGLGLSIVRRIMDKLEGECGVESNVGEGSLFYFSLPPLPPA